jgi:hypothetical protein
MSPWPLAIVIRARTHTHIHMHNKQFMTTNMSTIALLFTPPNQALTLVRSLKKIVLLSKNKDLLLTWNPTPSRNSIRSSRSLLELKDDIIVKHVTLV